MTTAAEVLDAWSGVSERLRDARDRCQPTIDSCPFEYRPYPERPIAPTKEQIEELFRKIEELMEMLGDPDALRDLATDWQQWGTDMGTNSDVLEADSLPTTLSWGEGGIPYRAATDSNRDAVGITLKDTGHRIQEVLDAIAEDIDELHLQILTLVISLGLTAGGLIVALIGVAGAIVGVVAAAPTGGLSLAASIIGLVAALGGFVMSAAGILNAIPTAIEIVRTAESLGEGAKAELEGVDTHTITPSEPLKGGEWPQVIGTDGYQ